MTNDETGRPVLPMHPVHEEPDSPIQLKYVGARFEGARLPLDVLADLPAFRDLLAAYAKAAYLGAHIGRKKVPKGFEKSLSFDLTGVSDGSAIPQLRWDRAAAQTLLPGIEYEISALVDGSLAQIVALVDEAANGHFPRALSPEHIRALNKFGSGLRDGERIEFVGSSGLDGTVVYLDRVRRKELITKIRKTYVTRVDGTGVLEGSHASNQGPAYVTVNTQRFGSIRIPLDGERIRSDFDGNIDSLIQFDIDVELDNADVFKGVVEVHGLTLTDEPALSDLDRCLTRLQELARVEAGWDGYDSKPVDGGLIHTAEVFLSARPDLSGEYRIFPTHAGGILIEFLANGWDISVELLSGGAVEIFGVEEAGDGELLPVSFPTLDEHFFVMFDELVGRDG